jgi:hypothetical protein
MKPLPENGPAASQLPSPSALQMLGLLPMRGNGPAVPLDGTRVEVSHERTMVARDVEFWYGGFGGDAAHGGPGAVLGGCGRD